MDYPRRAGLKIYATVEVLAKDDDPGLLARVTPDNYRARVERLFRFHLQAFDWNCPQHIMPRYSARQVAEYSQTLQQRIQALEQENLKLQQQLTLKENDHDRSSPAATAVYPGKRAAKGSRRRRWLEQPRRAKVALAYTADSQWRNRSEFVHGRAEIIGFLTRKWQRSSSTG